MSTITSRTVTVEAVGYKRGIGIAFGDGVIRVDYHPPIADMKLAIWTIEGVFDLPAFVEKLRAMEADAMNITVEEEGMGFKRVPREKAVMRSTFAAMTPEHVTHFHEQHPFTRNHRFKSLEQFETWVSRQPTA
jgi:hypothetical protein